MKNDDKPKRGRPPGTTNPESLDGKLDIRVKKSEKGEWVRKSRAAGLSLADWVRKKLNQAKK